MLYGPLAHDRYWNASSLNIVLSGNRRKAKGAYSAWTFSGEDGE